MKWAALSLAVAVGGLLCGSAATPVRAAGFPRFDIAGSCSPERGAEVGTDGSGASYRGCLADERAARRTLRRDWARFAPRLRRACRAETVIGGSPSYVEMLTCLNLDRETLPFRPLPMRPPGSAPR
ncbi:hypothetical protein [Methylobacterium gregans]|uniref:Secreted protein n=1 Tax=Methylobacterium gregans TaxID=374424 RepID=A0AA37MAE7_9HYPH|nr:hypothetical protein [Methylobacterium gregans]MDQ0522189.1 hypothetical protein [Methylobacterium gregans]GJD77808.1 hypothetical protein NBEOAGPD_1019 [Methylobacterium gregans]GLS57132.1 hypothetical protein GCM10007886_53180 [Methylobacterium gregans]